MVNGRLLNELFFYWSNTNSMKFEMYKIVKRSIQNTKYRYTILPNIVVVVGGALFKVMKWVFG